MSERPLFIEIGLLGTDEVVFVIPVAQEPFERLEDDQFAPAEEGVL